MRFKLLLFLIPLFLFSKGIMGQDAFHYTLFDFTGVAMNPALAGSFEGTARVGGLFREQDYGLQTGQYRNPVFYLDAPVIRGFRKNDWIGIGMYFLYDQQALGDVNLITNKFSGGLAYHFALDKKSKNILSIGIQSGSHSSYFSSPDITTWTEFGPNPLEDPIEASLPIKNPGGAKQGSTGQTSFTAGINYRSDMGNSTLLKIGFSVSNIGKISIGRKGGGGVSNSIGGKGSYSLAPLRFVVHGQYRTPIADRISIEPRVFFQYMVPSWELSVQGLTHFLLKPEKEIYVSGGLGYSIQNGLQLLFSTDIKNLRIAYSFDLNLSDKTAVSGAAAAFELGVSYIMKFYKKPKPDPVLVCPRL